MKSYLTREQIQEKLKALPRNPNIPTREQIRRQMQELAKTKPPRKPKNVVWS